MNFEFQFSFSSPVAQPPLKTEGSPSSSTEESMNEEHPPIPVAHILKRNPLDLKYVVFFLFLCVCVCVCVLFIIFYL